MAALGTDENQHEVVIVPPEEWELLQSVLKQDRRIKEERDNALIELAKSNAQLNALQNMKDPSEWGPYAKRFGQQLCLNMAIERDNKELTRQLETLKTTVTCFHCKKDQTIYVDPSIITLSWYCKECEHANHEEYLAQFPSPIRGLSRIDDPTLHIE